MQQKKFYKIGELVKLLAITPRTIRYYDQLGLLPQVKRTIGKMRLFDQEDVNIIKEIRHIQNETGLPLEHIREQLFGKKEIDNQKKRIVLSDSTIAVSSDFIKEYNVAIIPLILQINDQSFLETEISAQMLLEKSKNLEIPVKTKPPSEEDFITKYLELAHLGYKEIYSLHLSSVMSETYKNAFQASFKVADQVTVYPIDTKTAGPGQRAIVKEVAQAIKENRSKEEIDLLITKTIPMIYVLCISNTMKHLFANTNLSQFTSNQKNLIEKLFAFKPVLELTNGTGEFEILKWVNQKSEAIDVMLQQLESEIKNRGGYIKQILIDYNYLYGEALELINRNKQLYSETQIILQEGSAIFSSYLGPQTIAIGIQ